MIEMVLANLTLILQFGGLLVLSWFANFSTSLYYNINVLEQKFDKTKLINGLLKLLALCVGIAAFVIVITVIPIMLNGLQIPITEEFTELFNIIAIIGVFLTKGIYPYCRQAYETFSNIIEGSVSSDR